MSVTVSQLRKMYPQPKRASDKARTAGDYCVGGALCRYLAAIKPDTKFTKHMQDRNLSVGSCSFPSVHTVAEALKIANPWISLDRANELAYDVITYNDRGNFEPAWDSLQAGLGG